MTTLSRYWHTIRYLHAGQVGYRLLYKVYRPNPDTRPAPKVRFVERTWSGCARPTSLVSADRFRFLNVVGKCTGPDDWNRESAERLWLYNLHYFDDLVADSSDQRQEWHQELISRWVVENPPGKGTGWEPYPTSLRIVNWCKWAWSGNTLDDQAVHSLAVQTRWLNRRLEYHLLGNHLLANAKALVFAGAFFDGPEALDWAIRGYELLQQQLHEQILPDGGHFERSPMYHAIVLEDLLDLIQMAGATPILEGFVLSWRETAIRMLSWLCAMTHADGQPSFFNDTAMGIAPTLADLEGYASRLGLGATCDEQDELWPLTDSGYVRLISGAASLIADVGVIGPDYLPGHAHADTLSFEMSFGCHRVFVNAGISTYEEGPDRLWQRGTAAHNTVLVDDQDSSEVWRSFRVARRARPIDEASHRDGAGLHLKAGHTGYLRLPGRVRHDREWSLAPNRLVVNDRLTGSCNQAVARFRLHPDFRVTTQSDCEGLIEGHELSLSWNASSPVQIAEETWHPGFNRSMGCQVLEVPLSGGTSELTVSWQ